MSKHIQGKDGKFAGSIGDGKSAVPTPSSLPRRPSTSPAPAAQTNDPLRVYAVYAQVTSPSAEVEAEYAQALESASGGRMGLEEFSRLKTAATEYARSKDGYTAVINDAERIGGVLGSLLAESAATARADVETNQAQARAKTPGTLSALHTPRGWTITGHARGQAAEKGFSEADLIACVDNPQHTYESHRFPGQLKHVRGGLTVAVDPSRKTAITVFKDQEHTPLRADQANDKDAQAYAAKQRKQGGRR